MRDVLIIGGGLAGMTAGRALAKAGFPVTLLEGSARLGGKAGADISGGRAFEHGYHIFPAWYRNVRGLLAELGISLIDFDRWHYLKPEGESPRYVTQSVPDSLTSLLKMLRTGLLPWPDALLYWYFVLDMLGQPLSNKAVLDQVSRVGMMRDRWYMTKHIPEMEQENVLKASAIPAYEMSAMTAKLISSFWVRAPMPFLSILKGDLQSHFIEPYAATVRAAGVNVRLNEKVTKLVTTGGRISEVQSTGGSYHPELVLVTTPLEVTRKLMNGELLAIEPGLGNFEHLQAAPMASLHLVLDHRRNDLPREHVFLHGGEYGLSFIDVTPHWDPSAPVTTLSFIASNFIPLQELSEAEQYAALMREVTGYLGITQAQVTAHKLNANSDVPLFINTIGAWPNRPDVKAEQVENLFFAGDWVRNPIDLACMEGAVSAALNAAQAIAKEDGVTLPGAQLPERYGTKMLRALKWALAPAMLPVWLYSLVDDR